MKEINEYHNSLLIERFSMQKKISVQESEYQFECLKEFLLQCSLSSKPIQPSKQIDEMWHEFILFTRDYYYFCKNYLGQFVHHVPKMPATNSKTKRLEFVGVCDGGGDCDTGGNDGSDW